MFIKSILYFLRQLLYLGLFIFISSLPIKTPIDEDDLTIPINPYGDTKLVVETLLKWLIF